MSSLNDNDIKFLVLAGLFLQACAIAAGFTSAGWRWPLAGATAAIALGIALIVKPNDAVTYGVLAAALSALAAGATHLATPHPAAAWTVRIAFGIEALFLTLLLLFMLFFKMDRLF